MGYREKLDKKSGIINEIPRFKTYVGLPSNFIKKCALCAHAASSAVAVRQLFLCVQVRIIVLFYTIGNEVSYRIKKKLPYIQEFPRADDGNRTRLLSLGS